MKIYDIILEQDLANISEEQLKKWINSPSAPNSIKQSRIDFTAFDKIKRKLMSVLSGSTITLYRAVSIFYQDNPQKALYQFKTNAGTSWTYDINAADVYRPTNPSYEDKYILVAEVKRDSIDWFSTIARNMISVRGTFESEVKIKKNSTVKIIDVLDFNTKQSNKELRDEFKNKFFRT